ncbi:MAG: hypothetical protein ACO1QB_16390 [Verrucomicrobiales bacterium]
MKIQVSHSSEKRRWLRWHIISFVLLALIVSGCLSPRKKVDKKFQALRTEWETNVQHQANLPERVLDWQTATAIMLEKSLKLRQARIEVTNAQESVRQIFRDLVPTINLRAGVTKRLESLNTTTFDDVTFSADSFFNLPGLVTFGARLYAARLYQFRTEVAYQLAEREQMIELYRLFIGAEETKDQLQRLASQRATAGAMQEIDPFSGRLMQTELQTRELGAQRDVKTLQDRASELLGNRDYQWVFTTNGIPDLRYHQNPLVLNDTNRIAQLQLKLLAVELEAARAQLTGIKLRYWPDLNIFISGPPLWQRQNGQDIWWHAREMRGTADLFWSLDTRGYISRQLRQTKRQQELQKERYRLESLALMNRLLFTQNLIKGVEQQLLRVNAQLNLLLAVPPAQNYFSIQKYAVDYRSLTQQQIRLKRELAELNTLFWFVDEDAWRSQMTAFPKSGKLF